MTPPKLVKAVRKRAQNLILATILTAGGFNCNPEPPNWNRGFRTLWRRHGHLPWVVSS